MSRPVPKYSCIPASLAFLLLAGCNDMPGEISRDSKPFDGIDERAIITAGGTEPFWAVTIVPIDQGTTDLTIEANYSTPDMPEGQLFSMTRFAGNNGLGYSGNLNGQSVNLALTPGDCSDGMSERIYPYTATMLLGEETLYGCAHTDLESYVDP